MIKTIKKKARSSISSAIAVATSSRGKNETDELHTQDASNDGEEISDNDVKPPAATTATICEKEANGDDSGTITELVGRLTRTNNDESNDEIARLGTDSNLIPDFSDLAVNERSNNSCCSEQQSDDASVYSYEYEDDDAPDHQVETEAPSTMSRSARNSMSSSYSNQQAVSMSLRAERETNGGKRRLAQDLHRIMMTDTAGFSMEPTNEDQMEVWTIQLFDFDDDSQLHKDMLVLEMESVELEMTFPDQYPFEPPFVRVVRPRFKGGFIINGAICMELLTKDGWNPVNDIESVIVSIRSHLCLGNGRLLAAIQMGKGDYDAALVRAQAERKEAKDKDDSLSKRPKKAHGTHGYSMVEAKKAFAEITSIHEKGGWSNNWLKHG